MNIQLFTENQVSVYQESLKQLLQICMDNSFSVALPETFYVEKLESLQQYLRENRAYLFAATEGETLLGFLWACELAAPDGRRKFHVLYFSVLPQVQGRGIGKRLLGAAEEQARKMGIPQMELIVSQNNSHAVDFYQKQSYEKVRLILSKEVGEKAE